MASSIRAWAGSAFVLPLRRIARRMLRIDELERRLNAIQLGLHETREEAARRAKTRWNEAQPTVGLTWGRALDGSAFMAKVRFHARSALDLPGCAILEIGPGYGRLLRSALDSGVSFARWLGLDLSEENVRYLSDSFVAPGVCFVQGDVESLPFTSEFDLVISSLTFKHLFPSFEQALANVARALKPGGYVIFDLIEGSLVHFEHDKRTYVRHYDRPMVREIVLACGLDLVTFDTVRHDPAHPRLLVVARGRT